MAPCSIAPRQDPPTRGVVKRYLGKKHETFQFRADSFSRREACPDSTMTSSAARRRNAPSRKELSDLEHDRQDHRSAAGTVVDELADAVVQVLLEQLDLGDVVGQ